MIDESLIPQTARWNQAIKEADELTKVYSTPPIPVLEIAEQKGVKVIFANFGENADKVAGFCDFANAHLYVNAQDQLERQTFTIAHELGHWVLHKKIFEKNPERYPILARSQTTNQTDTLEQEANCFAANLLVPKRLIMPVKSALPTVLASIFAVSRTMMEYRLQNV